jgi:hypothetical protein
MADGRLIGGTCAVTLRIDNHDALECEKVCIRMSVSQLQTCDMTMSFVPVTFDKAKVIGPKVSFIIHKALFCKGTTTSRSAHWPSCVYIFYSTPVYFVFRAQVSSVTVAFPLLSSNVQYTCITN